MDNKKSSGLGGLVGVIGVIAVFLVIRNLFPLLAKILLIVGGILAVLVIGLVVMLVVSASKDNADGKPQQQNDDLLTKGRKNLLELRRIALTVKNTQVRSENEQICRTVEKILAVLKDQPQDIPAVRQFLNYYLPTLGSILRKFAKVEQSGVDAGDMVVSTLACLRDIQTAAEKQYANLFEDDLLDLSVEMEALTIACQRDGLLEEKPEESTGITLTL